MAAAPGEILSLHPGPPRARLRGDARPTADEVRIETGLIADLAPTPLLVRALHCAKAQGVPALDALIACTAADADDVVERLALRLGVVPLRDLDLPAGWLPANRAAAALQSGLMRLPDGGLVVAARGRAVVGLAQLLEAEPAAGARVRLAAPQAFTAAVMHAGGHNIARALQDGPSRVDPCLSARSPLIARLVAFVLIILGGVAALAALHVHAPADLLFAVLFMMLAGLRLLAARADPVPPAPPRLPDDMLPIYTIIVPLFHERRGLDDLVRALTAFDYPEAKLDIKLLLETGDAETAGALAACKLPNHFEILVVPPGPPRTKPRALNAGLAAARGSLLAVFDAEDRPDPAQLRLALDAFVHGGPRLACVQARLAIDNIYDSWLTRIFALEYAGLFDALLPALSRSGLFFPLGGTSNHFRTSALDRVGGWDAWNVTEDADLGVRFARLGYLSRSIRSTTLEEAPNTLPAWLRQRTRWLKGYVLTWAVHMRQPRRLFRELGLRNFLVFQAFVGGVPASALMLPIFIMGVAVHGMSGNWLSADENGLLPVAALLDALNLVFGFGVAFALAAIGADRRKLGRLALWVPTLPLYWLLSSIAAWRAVWQLIVTPHLWEKTEHGLARTSHAAQS